VELQPLRQKQIIRSDQSGLADMKTSPAELTTRLNYRQLQQFWAVARAGSIQRASAPLDLAPQTLSGQIASLEASLGVPLFQRVGRRLELTETGRMVSRYADQIFALGRELEDALRSGGQRTLPFRVGISEVVPKSLAYRLLAPALALGEPIRLVCREDKLGRLLAELAIHRLDLVLTDRPLPADTDIRAHAHRLGECGTVLLATPEIAARLRPGFPASLDGAPLLAPGEDIAMRARLLRWFDEQRVRPRIVGEFDDSALMKAFGAGGAGLVVAPDVVAAEVCRHYGLEVVGYANGVSERFYAITAQRRMSHPAVRAIHEQARGLLSQAAS
jgi:LysR family transcriptional activator of nhaA